MRAGLSLSVLFLLTGACSKTGESQEKSAVPITAVTIDTVKASCDLSAEVGSCSEYSPRERSSFGREKTQCETSKGKFKEGIACATKDQVGWCTLPGGEVKRYYVAFGVIGLGGPPPPPGFTPDEAKTDCEGDALKGTFTMDPNAMRPGRVVRMGGPPGPAPSEVSSALGPNWGRPSRK